MDEVSVANYKNSTLPVDSSELGCGLADGPRWDNSRNIDGGHEAAKPKP